MPEQMTYFDRSFGKVLRVLRWTGFYPWAATRTERRRRMSPQTMVFIAVSTVSACINVALLARNIVLIRHIVSSKGDGHWLHPIVMTDILLGLKPLQNCINFATFLANGACHRSFVALLRDQNAHFYEAFGVYPKWQREYALALLVVALLPFSVRLLEYSLMGSTQTWLQHTSLLLVPLLSIWQLTPLYYFIYICRTLRFWFSTLNQSLLRDINLTHKSIDDYYEHFMRLTRCLSSFNSFCHLYLFASLVASVICLCLTIYFLIHAQYVIGAGMAPNISSDDAIAHHFLPVWALLQIITSLVYALSITIVGMKTNEEARRILGAVLLVHPQELKGDFVVYRFVARIQTQRFWGLTAWRTFELERGLLFSVCGLIATYAVVLLKLRKDNYQTEMTMTF